MDEIVDAISDRVHDLPVGKLIVAASVMLLALVLSRLIRRVLRRAYWKRVAAVAELDREDELHRAKRQQTVLTLLESAARYGIYGGAAIVVVGLLFTNASNAIFTAGVGVLLVGFSLQRLLGDIIAGVLLLFEGRYAVGDFVQFHGQNAVSGIVEEFGVRTTTLRTLGGDSVTVLNGSIGTFTRYSSGNLEFHLEVLARGGDVQQCIEQVAVQIAGATTSAYLAGPTVEEVLQLDGGLTRITLRAAVAPSMPELCESVLPAQIEAALGDRIEGPVVALEINPRAWQTYSSTLPASR